MCSYRMYRLYRLALVCFDYLFLAKTFCLLNLVTERLFLLAFVSSNDENGERTLHCAPTGPFSRAPALPPKQGTPTASHVPKLKGYFTQKMTFCHHFTRPHVIPNHVRLSRVAHKRRYILKNVGNQGTLVPIDFHYTLKNKDA